MRLRGISSAEDANKYLREGDFIKNHNAKFSVKARKNGDAHRSIENYDLDAIFCSKVERKIANDFTVVYKSRLIQLEEQQSAIIKPKNIVTICKAPNGSLSVFIRDAKLNFKKIIMNKHRKLSPVEFVNQGFDLPILGNLENVVSQTNVGSEKRNFSLWFDT
jgi:hypothetical protein